MKFKYDEKGNIVTQDGKPVVILDDGKEETYDVLGKISELNQENASRRHDNSNLKKDLDQAKATLASYEELGQPKEIKSKLEKAEKNAPKDEEVRQLRESNASLEAQLEATTNQLTESQQDRDRLNGDIDNLTIGSAFSQSKWLSEKTILDPQAARAIFGRHFKAERQENGEVLVVGYVDPHDPQVRPIFSKDPNKGGAKASFDEAIAEIFNVYPYKDNYLKGGQDRPGSGGPGNRGTGGVPAGAKLTDLRTPKDKAEFISKHGPDSYKELVDRSVAEQRAAENS
jgi:hypothetical protein